MLKFKEKYPEFAAVEAHVRRAHAERSVAISHALVSAGGTFVRGMKKLFASLGQGYLEERDRRAIEADAFLKRSVPKY
jgi:hypothetical protein